MRIFQQAVEKTGELLGIAAGVSFRSPFIALGIAMSLSVLAFQSAKDLKIDGNLIALLPADFESVQALDEMKERYGGTGFVSIVIRSSDEAKLLEFAENAKVELEALPDIDYATYNRPSEFFRRHALYFIETADLEDLTEQLETRVEWERRNANPLYLDFEEEEAPPPLSLDHLKEKYLKKAGVGQAPQAKSPYLLDPDHQTLVLLARPRGISTDLHFHPFGGCPGAEHTRWSEAYHLPSRLTVRPLRYLHQARRPTGPCRQRPQARVDCGTALDGRVRELSFPSRGCGYFHYGTAAHRRALDLRICR